MRTLYLTRHAESDWKDTDTSDFERTLNESGKKEASFIGLQLNNLEVTPHLITSSSAKRAYQTIQLISNEIDYPFDAIEFNKSIYNANLNDLLKIVHHLPNNHSNIMLVGHNPTMTDLANYLTGNAIGNMPTCSVFKIELHIDNWQEIIQGIGSQQFFIYPKMY